MIETKFCKKSLKNNFWMRTQSWEIDQKKLTKKKYSICFFFLSLSCPVDNYVFPGLDRLRDGDSLEARFNAFKIPESNFLVFEATVRSCRDGCQPAYCSGGAGRSEPSFGKRRRRSVLNETVTSDGNEEKLQNLSLSLKNDTSGAKESNIEEDEEGEEERVREMIEVTNP